MRATGSTTDVLARGAMALTECPGGDVDVPEGEVRVSTVAGKDVGLDIDRVVLRSAAAARRERRLDEFASVPPTVTVESAGRVSYSLRVEDATEPFWLVLGQSRNDGWKATVKGQGSLGAPTLIDGYANGWYVTPTGSEPIEITLTWTPQRILWIAIALSALGLLGCIAILFVTTVRRRDPDANDDAPELADWHTYGGSTPRGDARRRRRDHRPRDGVRGGMARRPDLGRRGHGRNVVARLRPVVIVLAPAALAAAALFILAKQLRYSLEPSFEWPTYFDKVHVLGWVAGRGVGLRPRDP